MGREKVDGVQSKKERGGEKESKPVREISFQLEGGQARESLEDGEGCSGASSSLFFFRL